MAEQQRNVTLQVTDEELRLIQAGLDLLLMTEDDRDEVAELKVLIARLRDPDAVAVR